MSVTNARLWVMTKSLGHYGGYGQEDHRTDPGQHKEVMDTGTFLCAVF